MSDRYGIPDLDAAPPKDCAITPGCVNCAGHLPPCTGKDGKRVYAPDETIRVKERERCEAIVQAARMKGGVDLRSIIHQIRSGEWPEKEE